MSVFDRRAVSEQLEITARDLLSCPPDMHLRLAFSAVGSPEKVHGHWPIITDFIQGPGGDNDLIHVFTEGEGFFRLRPDDSVTVIVGWTNPVQDAALRSLCERYDVTYNPYNYWPRFDLPKGYVAGWVGSVYFGVDPDGRASS